MVGGPMDGRTALEVKRRESAFRIRTAGRGATRDSTREIARESDHALPFEQEEQRPDNEPGRAREAK